MDNKIKENNIAIIHSGNSDLASDHLCAKLSIYTNNKVHQIAVDNIEKFSSKLLEGKYDFIVLISSTVSKEIYRICVQLNDISNIIGIAVNKNIKNELEELGVRIFPDSTDCLEDLNDEEVEEVFDEIIEYVNISHPTIPQETLSKLDEWEFAFSTQEMFAYSINQSIDTNSLINILIWYANENSDDDSHIITKTIRELPNYQDVLSNKPTRRRLNLNTNTLVLDEASAKIIGISQIIATKVSGKKSIYIRHIIAAIFISALNDNYIASICDLFDEETIFDDLCKSLLHNIKDGNVHEEINFWSSILINHNFIFEPKIFNYHTDDIRGKDLIGITKDATTFARFLTYKNIFPPLAIGIFGDWGSGKTFFMNKIMQEVDLLSKEARESSFLQKDIAVYKNIAQIEFNAWHYSPGNIWPSLISHIFDNLSLSKNENRNEIQNRRKYWLEQLKKEKVLLEGIDERKNKLEFELEEIDNKITDINTNINSKTEKLTNIKASDVFELVAKEGKTKEEIEKLLKDIGFKELSENSKELFSTLSLAQKSIKRSSNIILPLLKAPDYKWRLFFIILILLASPMLGILLKWLIHDNNFGNISAILSSISAFLTGLVVWIRKQIQWGTNALDKIEIAKNKVDLLIYNKTNTNNKQIEDLEKEIKELKNQLDMTCIKRKEASAKVSEIEDKLEQISPTQLLNDFIQERTECDDYRKHLGLIAIVRKDFEKLSDLIKDQNENFEKLTDIEIEKVKWKNAINRIILYIDDLDRCKPKKVVEVLQAIHLLMAFPLFIVIVGVDSRWIKCSLEDYFKVFENDNQVDTKFNSLCYMEKIFQIPYQLSEVGNNEYISLIDGLIHGDNIDLANNPNNNKSNSDNNSTSKPNILIEDSKISPSSDISQRINDSTFTRNRLNLEMMKINDYELECLQNLEILMKGNPRSIKRFLNVYQLIKAGMSEEDDIIFRTKNDNLAGWEIVLFLLSLSVNMQSLFNKLNELINEGSENNLSQIYQKLCDSNNINTNDLCKFKSWMETSESNKYEVTDTKLLKKWINVVKKFSFG